MKVACLVMAYRGAPVLRHMASVYTAAGWDVFVHLDRKAELSDYLHALGDARAHCRFVEDRVEVFWGGFSMIQAELKLIHAARQVAAYDRYVLISDDAIPIRPAADLQALYQTDTDFIELNRQPEGSEYHRRYADFFFLDHPATAVRRPGYLLLAKLDDRFFAKTAEIAALQQRGKKAIEVYWGSQFWSLTAKTVELVEAAIADDEHLVRSFEFAAIPDELLFQSVIGNSQADRSIRGGPVYADWYINPGPRTYARMEELPYDFLPHHAFLRKVAPSAERFISAVAARLLEGKGLYPLHPGADRSDSIVVDTDQGPLAVVTMQAPTPGDTANGWHPVERAGRARFRWTAAETVEFGPFTPLPSAHRIRIVVPYLMTISPDFSKSCQISFAGRTLPAVRRGRAMFADFEVGDGGELKAVLSTPTPLSPYELTGSTDRRLLGLAVRLSDAPQEHW
jgi:Core-2/I-Branching enzyme